MTILFKALFKKMIYRYQEDSFLREFTTKLVEIIEDEFMVTVSPGTQKKVKGHGLVFEDTILFAEGGGQPSDQGTVTIWHEERPIELIVVYVFKKENRVIHVIEETEHSLMDLPAGLTVHETLLWERRHYHMIHHSGQHLISALAEQQYQFQTLSWCLGQDYCFVELGVEAMSDQEFKDLETQVNAEIQKALPVTVLIYKENDPELQNAKTRGLPEGHIGDVRVIKIGDLDRNMCCGTHVSSLQELQVVKFLKTEKKVFKKKQTCLLYFIVGQEKVFKMFDDMRKRQDLISACLNKGPAEHVDTITHMKQSLRTTVKKMKELQEEAVMGIINAFKSKVPLPPLFSLHRTDGDQELLNFIVRQFKSEEENLIIFLTVGEGEKGMMLLTGPKDQVLQLGPQVCSVLSGKGKASNNRFQAKVENLGSRAQAEDLLKQALSTPGFDV